MVEFGTKPHDSRDDEFEQELRAGLQPRPAPAGFADRVLARVDAVPHHEPAPWPVRTIRNPLVRGAIAATLLFSVGVGATSSISENARSPANMLASKYCSRSELPAQHCRMFATRWTATTRTI